MESWNAGLQSHTLKVISWNPEILGCGRWIPGVTRCSEMIVSLNLSFQRAFAGACYCLMCQKIRKFVIWPVLLPGVRWLLLIVVIQKFSSVIVALYNILQLLGCYFIEAKNNIICFWCTVLACSRHTQMHAGLNWCLQQK